MDFISNRSRQKDRDISGMSLKQNQTAILSY